MSGPDDTPEVAPSIAPRDLAPRSTRRAMMGGGGEAYERDPFGLGDTPAHLLEPIRRMRRNSAGRAAWTIFFRGTLVVVGAWVLAQALDRALPTETAVAITTPAVVPGADLKMDVLPNLLRRCEAKVKFRALDRMGNKINESETPWQFPMAVLGKPDKAFTRSIRISRDAVPSKLGENGTLVPDASLRIERYFFCNPVQKALKWPIVELTDDMPFAIVPDSPR